MTPFLPVALLPVPIFVPQLSVQFEALDAPVPKERVRTLSQSNTASVSVHVVTLVEAPELDPTRTLPSALYFGTLPASKTQLAATLGSVDAAISAAVCGTPAACPPVTSL